MLRSILFYNYLILTFIVPTIALAANNSKTSPIKVTTECEKQIRASMSDLGIDKATQNKLIEKLKRGEMLDSMNPEKLSQIPEDTLTATLEEPVKTYTFPDGSVIKVEIKVISERYIPKQRKGPESLGWQKDITIKSIWSATCYEVVYYSDISLIQYQYDYIRRGPYHWRVTAGCFGDYSDVYTKIDKKYESGSGPASEFFKGET